MDSERSEYRGRFRLQRAHDIYKRQEDNFQRRELLDEFVSKGVIKVKTALSNLREPFSTPFKPASAAGSGSDDQG